MIDVKILRNGMVVVFLFITSSAWGIDYTFSNSVQNLPQGEFSSQVVSPEAASISNDWEDWGTSYILDSSQKFIPAILDSSLLYPENKVNAIIDTSIIFPADEIIAIGKFDIAESISSVKLGDEEVFMVYREGDKYYLEVHGYSDDNDSRGIIKILSEPLPRDYVPQGFVYSKDKVYLAVKDSQDKIYGLELKLQMSEEGTQIKAGDVVEVSDTAVDDGLRSEHLIPEIASNLGIREQMLEELEHLKEQLAEEGYTYKDAAIYFSSNDNGGIQYNLAVAVVKDSSSGKENRVNIYDIYIKGNKVEFRLREHFSEIEKTCSGEATPEVNGIMVVNSDQESEREELVVNFVNSDEKIWVINLVPCKGESCVCSPEQEREEVSPQQPPEEFPPSEKPPQQEPPEETPPQSGISPRTIGYWKNHPDVLEKILEENDIFVGGERIDTVDEAMEIMWGANARDAKVMLKAQLLATKLNIANGASYPREILDVIREADQALKDPDVDRSYLLELKDHLDAYNNSGEASSSGESSGNQSSAGKKTPPGQEKKGPPPGSGKGKKDSPPGQKKNPPGKGPKK